MKPLRHVSLGCALLLIAAAQLAAQEKLKQTPYYPLQVGTTWHYRAGDRKIILRVARHEKTGDTLCAVVEATRDGKVVGTEHLAVTGDGVYRHMQTIPKQADKPSVQHTLKPPMLVLKLPPKQCESWKIDSKSEKQTFRGGFQVGEQEITVPAGTYKTFRVASQDLEIDSLKANITTFFAAGVGMVKQIIEVGDAKVEIELEKFTLARSP